MSLTASHYIRPHFGQAVIYILVLFAFDMGHWVPHFAVVVGEKNSPVSILSFLPVELLSNTTFAMVLYWMLRISIILWIFQLFIPWSSWLTAVSFMALTAFRYENARGISHTSNITSMLLVVHALWYHFYRHEIKAHVAAGDFWSTKLYPRWVFVLSLFYICLFHTLAGLTKLLSSGVTWPNGLSLQLWVHLWGKPSSWSADLILSNRGIAAGLQWFTLVVETGAILAVLPLAHLRWLIGVALLCLYAGINDTFGYGFYGNAMLVAVFLLPFETLARAAYRYGHESCRVFMQIHRFPSLFRMVVNRLDVFDVVTIEEGPQH